MYEVGGEEGEPHVLQHVVEAFGHALLSLVPHTHANSQYQSISSQRHTRIFGVGGCALVTIDQLNPTPWGEGNPLIGWYRNRRLGILLTELIIRYVKKYKRDGACHRHPKD